MKSVSHQLQILKKGIDALLPEDALKQKLQAGRPLIIKFGMDPTAPDLHLGHVVVLSKLKEFQDLGHTVVVIIGDYTASIGDPSGKSKTRPPLSREEIRKNTQTYFDQVAKILDPSKLTIRYNNEWLGKLTSQDIVNLLSKITLARIIERDDFQKRIDSNNAVYMHELLYPLFQGYDSVVLHADIEIGGTDQTFNLLMGRYLQEQAGQEPQVVITMPLLEGLDGTEKMSKSLGNAIGLDEKADQAYAKLMSISDVLMWRYYQLLLRLESDELARMQARVAAGTLHPMELKKEMAHALVSRFWSPKEAEEAQQQFESIFENRNYSDIDPVSLAKNLPNPIWIVALLKELNAVKSSSEAKRLIEAGAVRIDNTAITDFKAEISYHSGTVVKVGKYRIYKLA